MKSQLTKAVAILLLLPTCGALVVLWIFYSFLTYTVADAHFINVASRERMLLILIGAAGFNFLVLLAGIWIIKRYDVADEEQVEDDSLESEGRIQAIVDNVVEGIITINSSGIIQTANAATERIFVYPADEMIGQNVKLLMPEPYHSEHDGYLSNYLQTGERKIIGIGREVVGQRKDGSTFPMELAVSEDRLGGERLFTGIVRDITERKATENALRESEARTQAIVDTAVDGIITIDERGLVETLNPAAEKIFGYSSEEVTGQNVKLLMPEPYHSEHDGYLSNYLQTGERKIIGIGREVVGQRKDGSTFPMDLAVSEMVLGDHRKFVGLVRDITERKAAAAEVLAAKDAAEEANMAKGRFLANMSHELRTPLHAVIGYSEMLQEEAEDLGLQNFIPDLQTIQDSGKYLQELINGILDLSKIEAGKMDLFLETFVVSEVVDQVVTTVRPLAEKNGNRLEIQYPDAPDTMHADMTKVRQILFNLLSNACKFTEGGEVSVDVSREMKAEGDVVVFRVQDTGIGMDSKQVEHLFEPFSQADASSARRYEGTGLGLAITRQFCHMMGGEISVDTAPGEGSVFTVRLPIRASEHKVAEQPPPLQEPRRDVSALPVERAEGRETILVIDDDPSARNLLSRNLSREGFRVVTASGGGEGIRRAREERPSLITLDVLMPGLDGWSILTALKADPELAEIPVIMATIVDDRNRGYSLGASDYLIKPLSRDRLSAVLKRYRCRKPPCRVLIIEDNSSSRELMVRTLSREGWIPIEAENGRVGLDRAVENKPDLVLLDLMMPEMDGFEFIEEFRKTEAWRKIPIVVVTAMELTEDDRLRLNGYVEKILQKEDDGLERVMREITDMVTTYVRPENIEGKSHGQDSVG